MSGQASRRTRFSEPARKVLSLAQDEAERLGHDHIGTEDLLLGLLRQPDSAGVRALEALGIESARVRAEVELIVGRSDLAEVGIVGLTSGAKRVIVLAIDESRALAIDGARTGDGGQALEDQGAGDIGTEHVLIALILESQGVAAGVLTSLGVTAEGVRGVVAGLGPEQLAGGPGGGPSGPASFTTDPRPVASGSSGARRRAASGSPFETTIGFSRAVRVGDRVLVSGTAPIWPDGHVDPDPGVQAERCFEIILAALAELGATARDVTRTRMYIVDPAVAEAVGTVHGRVFGEARPAATMVVVAALLDPRWKVEIEAEALIEPRMPSA